MRLEFRNKNNSCFDFGFQLISLQRDQKLPKKNLLIFRLKID